MATRAQKVKVGLFLVVSILLIGVGLLIVAGFSREEKATYFVEFDESVLGLYVGSLVVYQGVEVGSVKDIRVTEDKLALIEVEISKDNVTLHEEVQARLAIYSFVTGTMCISLEGGDPSSRLLAEGSTIPATKSRFETVSTEVEGILADLDEIVEVVRTGLEGMEDGQLKKVVENADGFITEGRELEASAKEILAMLKDGTHPTMADFKKTAEKVGEIADSTNRLVKIVTEKIEPLKLAETQEELRLTLQTIRNNADLLSKNLDTMTALLDTTTRSMVLETEDIEFSLRETLRIAAESLRKMGELLEYLERNPLIRGRTESSGGD